MMMMIDVLRPLLCKQLAKLAERLSKVVKRSQRCNNLQICPCREIRTRVVVICGLTCYQLDHGGARVWVDQQQSAQIIKKINQSIGQLIDRLISR